jgi:hypothetical protein
VEDIKVYIESGVLELYVLGELSQEEALQVEAMASKNPSVKAELDEIERSMELFARENAVEPAAHLRDRILDSVFTSFGDDSPFISKPDPEIIKGKIIAMPQPAANSFYKYAFAACLALLVASSVVLVTLYNRLQQSNQQIAVLQSDKQHFANTVSLKEGELQVYRDPSFKLLKLNGTAKSPLSRITVAWSPVNKKVWIDLRSLKVPENDKDHQYQLWALVAGKPVDLGVFDDEPDSTDMKEMKPVASAGAFAVTLEPRGGSVNPTMDKMVVIGTF